MKENHTETQEVNLIVEDYQNGIYRKISGISRTIRRVVIIYAHEIENEIVSASDVSKNILQTAKLKAEIKPIPQFLQSAISTLSSGEILELIKDIKGIFVLDIAASEGVAGVLTSQTRGFIIKDWISEFERVYRLTAGQETYH